MNKSWDCIREVRRAPITSGLWSTKVRQASVGVNILSPSTAHLQIGGPLNKNIFEAADLQELASFCLELSDQLSVR